MKSRLSRIMLSILILGLALHTFTLPAQAQSEPNENQARFENMPSELAERYRSHSENGERQDAIPPSPEIIAKTQTQVANFDCANVTDVSQIECEALVALYESTNGAGWKNNTNWLQTNTVGDWSNVKVFDRSVESLFFYQNQLNGNIPSELGNLSNLWHLYLQENQLTGSIPSTLSNLSHLRVFYLYDNQLTGSIPEEFGNLSNMKWMDFNNNRLTGSIPSTLGNLSNLATLLLNDNQLTGNIPSSLGNLSNLVTLHLSWNQLTGSIPEELGDLSDLQSLYLDNNQLIGSIPPILGEFSDLHSLYLDNNQLTGNIPEELGKLSRLAHLNLSNNQLSGSIPAELGQLTRLRYLILNDNLFEGDIPNTVVNLVNLCEGINEANDCSWWLPSIGLDLGYNQLKVPAQEPVASFLEIKDSDWFLTQAVKITIPGESGGIIQSRDGMTEIEIPAGAYTGEMTFHLIPHSSPGHPLGSLMEANNYFELIATVNGEEINSFSIPLKVTINYTNQQIGPILEDSLKLYHWNSDQSAWNDALSTCPGGEYIRNPEENRLSLPLCELGEFALLGETQNVYLPLVRR